MSAEWSGKLKNLGKQKRVAVFNDLTGYGRCGLTVSLPIISHMKMQCCVVPTAILSNHTGYNGFYFEDYTKNLTAYLSRWGQMELRFNAVLTGFMGCELTIDRVEDYMRIFRRRDFLLVVDPVMGDNGTIATTYTEKMCMQMRRLVAKADIITPNLTEACKLTDTPYKKGQLSENELAAVMKRLQDLGPSKIVITGIEQDDQVANYYWEKGGEPAFIRNKKVGKQRCGTGDVFAAIITADAVNGVDFATSIQKAADFIEACMARSVELEIPEKNGVCFEELLDELKV